jgi:hypothetical protein
MAIDWRAELRAAKAAITSELDAWEEAQSQASDFINSVVKPTFEAVSAEIKASYLDAEYDTNKSSGTLTVTLGQNTEFTYNLQVKRSWDGQAFTLYAEVDTEVVSLLDGTRFSNYTHKLVDANGKPNLIGIRQDMLAFDLVKYFRDEIVNYIHKTQP